MTILLKPTEDDIVLFTDTGREHAKTYQFIADFSFHEHITVHIASFTHKRSPGLIGFPALTNYKTYLPNRVKRICTDELKIKTAKRWLRQNGVQKFENYIGFRADETHGVDRSTQRYKKVFPKYPLVDMGITKEMVNQYWLTKEYTLEIPPILGNCDLCFLKGKDNIIKILQQHPELAAPWIANEDHAASIMRGNPTFIKGVTYRELLRIAQSQKTLFDLDDAVPAYSCSCRNS